MELNRHFSPQGKYRLRCVFVCICGGGGGLCVCGVCGNGGQGILTDVSDMQSHRLYLFCGNSTCLLLGADPGLWAPSLSL